MILKISAFCDKTFFNYTNTGLTAFLRAIPQLWYNLHYPVRTNVKPADRDSFVNVMQTEIDRVATSGNIAGGFRKARRVGA